MYRSGLLMVLPMMLFLVVCDDAGSETDANLPSALTTAVPVVPGDRIPAGGPETLEIRKAPRLSNIATPAANVAPAPSEPVPYRVAVACSPDVQTLKPVVSVGDSWRLTGPIVSEGSTPDKKPYLGGIAVSGSWTFRVTDSGVTQEWAFQDKGGKELDRYGSPVEWVPHVITDGTPALTRDWNCHKNAWLTGGVGSFSYYTRDYTVEEKTLNSGMEVVLFKLDTTFYSSDEDMVRHTDSVYGYDKITGRIVVTEKHEYGTLDGVPFSLSQRYELDADMDISSQLMPMATEVPTLSPPAPIPLSAPVVTPTSQTGQAITSIPATTVPSGVPSVDAPPVGSLTLEDCQSYLALEISAGGETREAVVTSYRCGRGYVDSTGRSPSRTPSLIVTNDSPIELELLKDELPMIVEARLYSGVGISAWFTQWPDSLPPADKAVATFQIEPANTFEIATDLSSGNYSLVVKATWQGPVEVFYALSLAVE